MTEEQKLTLVLHLSQCEQCRASAYRRMSRRHLATKMQIVARRVTRSENDLTLKDALTSLLVVLAMGACSAVLYWVIAGQ